MIIPALIAVPIAPIYLLTDSLETKGTAVVAELQVA
jgi:hypothetical protein